MRQERREKAIQILKPFAKKCKVTDYEYFLVLKDHRDSDDYEEIDCEPFCEDCIKSQIREYRNEHREELRRNKKIIWYQEYYSVSTEQDSFEYCADCGKMINISLLFNDQELEHWESLEELNCSDPETAYELREIFEQNDDEFNDRIDTLAEKVIAEHGGDDIIDSFEVKLLDFLSPDIYLHSYIPMKYGVERTLMAAEYLTRTVFGNLVLNSVDWKRQLFDYFHKALLQEYNLGQDVDINELKKRRKKMGLIKPAAIRIDGYTVTRWEHEIDEDMITCLLTAFNGKKLKINPQGKDFFKRDDWDWQVNKVSVCTTGYGISIWYDYIAPKAAKGSRWTNHIEHEKGETVIGFLERCLAWFEENTV